MFITGSLQMLHVEGVKLEAEEAEQKHGEVNG